MHNLSVSDSVLTAPQADQLTRYAARLAEANVHINLVARTDPAAITQRHIPEAVALVAVLAKADLLPAGATVIDVGTGGGLPGIPLAILRPDVQVTLLDADQRKCDMLGRILADLALPKVTVHCARAETAGQDPTLREQFDLALARAVAPLDVLVELTLPLIRVGGALAAVKGSRVDEECAAATGAIHQCGGELSGTVPLTKVKSPPSLPAVLTVVLIRKVGATPATLPRRPGIPAKRPLRSYCPQG